MTGPFVPGDRIGLVVGLTWRTYIDTNHPSEGREPTWLQSVTFLRHSLWTLR